MVFAMKAFRGLRIIFREESNFCVLILKHPNSTSGVPQESILGPLMFILISKPEYYGACDESLPWFENYFSGRKRSYSQTKNVQPTVRAGKATWDETIGRKDGCLAVIG